jgi:hypothetical protein
MAPGAKRFSLAPDAGIVTVLVVSSRVLDAVALV